MRGARADEIGEKEGFYFGEVAAIGEARGHLAAAVAIVGVFPFGTDGFFAVEERDPDVVAAVLRTKQAGEFEHYAGGGAGIIGADKIFEALGVVMRAEENHAGFIARNFDENVFHGDAAGGSIRGEGIDFSGAAVAFQFGEDVVLRLGERWRARGARPERDLLGDVVEGALAVKAAGFVGRGSFVTG